MALLILFCFVAVALTVAMFLSRSPALGFPSAIFWALVGGQSYIQSTATWDMYFLAAFATLLGMVAFCAFSAYGLKTKKEELATGEEFIDEGKDDMTFFDEGASPSESRQRYDEYGSPRRAPKKADEEVVSARVKGIRERAAARRSRLGG